jgi:hypothetical protein
VIEPGKLGKLGTITVEGEGDYGLNLYFDLNEDGEFFNWDGNEYQGVGDDAYALYKGSVDDGILTVTGETEFILVGGGGDHTLLQLKAEYDSDTKIGIWIGVNSSNGNEKTATINSVTIEEGQPIQYASTSDVEFDITVDYGTGEDDAIANLATTVAVTGSEGEKGTATIAWTIENYDGNVAGEYTATGVLTLPDGWMGEPADVTAVVTVEPAPPVINTTQEKGYDKIQAAIDEASVGDTIEVAAGTYMESIIINKANLTLKSKDGADKTIIDADGARNAVKITADGVTVDGFTISLPMEMFSSVVFNYKIIS